MDLITNEVFGNTSSGTVNKFTNPVIYGNVKTGDLAIFIKSQ